jgi:hypothetical protein
MGEGEREILRRLDLHEGLLKTIITKVEARTIDAEVLEDKIRRLERTESSLADISFKLAAAKALSSWVPGAVAGAVAALVVVSLLQGIALAH